MIVQILNVSRLEAHVEPKLVALDEHVDKIKRALFFVRQRRAADICSLLNGFANVTRTQLTFEVVEQRHAIFGDLRNAAGRFAAQAVMKAAEQAIERLGAPREYLVIDRGRTRNAR